MTILTTGIVLIVVFTISLAATFIWHDAIAPRAIFMTCAVLFVTLVIITGVAINHGLYSLQTPIIDTIATLIQNDTPVDESATTSADQVNVAYAFYRFGCPDCEATHDDLVRWADENDIDLTWISTRSEKGRKLFNAASIDQVPAIEVINRNGERLTRVVYSVDPSTNRAIPNDKALDALAKFAKES